MAVLLVEQHIHQALAISDRAYILVGGQIVLTEDAATLANDQERVSNAYFDNTPNIQQSAYDNH
jgi:branched-chain amino acid transport system ATP-binding protein